MFRAEQKCKEILGLNKTVDKYSGLNINVKNCSGLHITSCREMFRDKKNCKIQM